MSQLSKLQTDFQSYLLGNTDADDLKKYIVDDETIGASKRVGIYFDAYRLRILETLQTHYPKLHALLGDDLFEKSARSYINAFPSEHRNMRWVGNEMTGHLSETLSEHPVAAEMASFEWSLGLAFDAADKPTITINDLASIPFESWGELTFKFHPSVQLLNIEWNIIPIWQALDEDVVPPAPSQTHTPCLVWREDLNSHYRSIDAAEFDALQLLMGGASFGDLCEHCQLQRNAEEATQQAANFLAAWINAELLLKV
jgi:hypothetical protein